MGRLAVQIEDTGTGLEGLAFGGSALGAEPISDRRARLFLSGVHDLGQVGDLLAEMTVTIPVVSKTLDDFGAERIQDGLLANGWRATVRPLFEQKKLGVLRLRRVSGTPFSEAEGVSAIQSVSTSFGTRLAALSGWAKTVVKVAQFVAEAPGTALSQKGREQTFDVVKGAAGAAAEFVTNPICGAIEGATGLKCRTVVIGGAVIVGLFFAWPVISPFITVGAERIARRLR